MRIGLVLLGDQNALGCPSGDIEVIDLDAFCSALFGQVYCLTDGIVDDCGAGYMVTIRQLDASDTLDLGSGLRDLGYCISGSIA